MPTPQVMRRKRQRPQMMDMGPPAKRFAKPKKRANLYNMPYRIKRTFNKGDVSTDGINPLLTTLNFSLEDLPGSAELKGLFHFYRITGSRSGLSHTARHRVLVRAL